MLRQRGPVHVSGPRAAVIGHPISHSRSPQLHAAAYRVLGLDIAYGRLERRPDDAPAVAEMLRTEPDWLGLSVTMPMKQPMLAEMDHVDPLAATLGALNTVVLRPDGLHGLNTDVEGVRGAVGLALGAPLAADVSSAESSQRTTPSASLPLAGTVPLVLGAGGTAAAAIAGLARLGAQTVCVAVRDPSRTRELLRVTEALGVEARVISLTSVTSAPAPRAVVSTLPPRAADDWAEAVATLASPGAALLDAAYDPWPSRLAAAWQDAGGTPVHGLAMLVHQAVGQVAAFTGRGDAASPAVLAALYDAAGITPQGSLPGIVAG